MDFNSMITSMKGQVTPVSAVLFVLLVISEFLGANEKVKASAIYGIVKSVLMTIKDQVWPTRTEETKPVASTEMPQA